LFAGDLSEVSELKGLCRTVLDSSKINFIPILLEQVKEV